MGHACGQEGSHRPWLKPVSMVPPVGAKGLNDSMRAGVNADCSMLHKGQMLVGIAWSGLGLHLSQGRTMGAQLRQFKGWRDCTAGNAFACMWLMQV